jgi:hypothetical protein
MKKPLARRLMLSAMITAVAFAVLGCKDTTTGTTTSTTVSTTIGQIPGPSNMNEIFFQGNGFSVTYGDFYQEFKINDGLNLLLMMIDDILFSSYAQAVTPEEIEEKIQYLTFGLLTDEQIAALSEAERQDYLDTYQNNMFLLGYEGNEEAYIRMLCGKENFAREAMVDPTYSEQTWYIGEDDVAAYYRDYYYQDVTAIKIRCVNEEDAKNVLRAFNLVSYQGKLRFYTGTLPIDQVPSFGFNDSNTRDLTDDELLAAFLGMYNLVYGDFRSPIDPDSTLAELLALPELKVAYTDAFAVQADMAKFLFGTLSAFNDPNATKLSYSYVPASVPGANDSAAYLILKLDDPNGGKADLSKFDAKTQDLLSFISQAEYDEIVDRLIEKNVATSGTLSKIIGAKRARHNFKVLDYYLGLDYQMAYSGYTPVNEGSATVVASMDGAQITADQLITYAMERNATLYSMYAAQMPYAMNHYFPLVYCANETVGCEFNLDLNRSQKIKDHLTTLAELKTNFEESYYSRYYQWNQWLFLAYGVTSEAEMIRNYYVKSTLQPYIIYDGIRQNEWELLTDYLYDLIQEYYDGYFDLFADQLLITLDRNENGTADVYADFLAGLEDRAAYDALVDRFELAIRSYLSASETNSFTTLIRTYNKALRSDPTWGEFKRYGFFLSQKDLSGTESTTYLSAKKDEMETAVIDALAAAYQEYQLPENIQKSSLLYSGSVVTAEGLAFLQCEKGSNFERPSAQFANIKNSQDAWVYSEGVDNTEAFPSLQQLKLYCEYRFDQMVYGNDAAKVLENYGVVLPKLPASLIEAMDAYFAPIHDSMYVIGYLNIIVADRLAEGTYINAVPAFCDQSDAELKLRLSRIRAIYQDQVFGEYEPKS